MKKQQMLSYILSTDTKSLIIPVSMWTRLWNGGMRDTQIKRCQRIERFALQLHITAFCMRVACLYSILGAQQKHTELEAATNLTD